MPRGGRRPGAGAPKGNFNGLRTGLHSPRVLAAIKAAVTDPVLWQALRRLSAEPEFAGRRARVAWQRQMRKDWRKNLIKKRRGGSFQKPN